MVLADGPHDGNGDRTFPQHGMRDPRNFDFELTDAAAAIDADIATSRYRDDGYWPLSLSALTLSQGEPEKLCITSIPMPTSTAVTMWQSGIVIRLIGPCTHFSELPAPCLP